MSCRNVCINWYVYTASTSWQRLLCLFVLLLAADRLPPELVGTLSSEASGVWSIKLVTFPCEASNLVWIVTNIRSNVSDKNKIALRCGMWEKYVSECDVPVPGIPGTGNFSFFWWYRYRYRKILVPEKSLGTGIGKIWYRKKSRNRYRINLVPEKSTGIGIENIWYQKKYRYRYRLKFWVSSHTDILTLTHLKIVISRVCWRKD